jgi:hypothetical protein
MVGAWFKMELATTEQHRVFLTNPLEMPARRAVLICRGRRWIEWFFRWINGRLQIKRYHGTSPKAVKIQIWIVLALGRRIASIDKQLSLPGT